MEKEAADKLLSEAADVLAQNDRGSWTVPAGDLYPHQWLWDSCFVAIGLRHLNVERAQTELVSLLAGQWENGMLPNIIFSKGLEHRADRELWRSWVSPYAPPDVHTSGITQPPMVAEAVTMVGQKLKLPERRSWFKQMYPALVDYHNWLYAERDPREEGLIVLLHPYESGLDNSPPWIIQLRQHTMPLWISAIEKIRLDVIVNLFRRDVRHVPPGQRMNNAEALAYWAALRGLRRKAYNSEAVLRRRPLFAIEDLAFNCMLVQANRRLKEIAQTIGRELPADLSANAAKTEQALEELWDESSGYYYSRDFVRGELIKEPTIASLLPLYAGTVSKGRAAHLVNNLKQRRKFGTSWPVPSVPANSTYFDPFRYWQGPSWINTNWLIIEGLKRYGYEDEAQILKNRTIEMVDKNGCAEYFNPLTGQPAGAADFSWTAALTVDLIKT
jgi:hypothetical protein